MDAHAKKKALYRAKLKAQNPLVRYNESDQPVCKVCDIVLKSEFAWSAHQISAKHCEAIQNVKANAAAARVNNVKLGASIEYNRAKPEQPVETYRSQTRPPQAQPQSGLPPNFFDNFETKSKQNGEEASSYLEVLRQSFLKPPSMSDHAMDEENALYMDTFGKFLNPPRSMKTYDEIECDGTRWNKVRPTYDEIECDGTRWNKVRPIRFPDMITNIKFYRGDLRNRVSDQAEDPSEVDLRDPLDLFIEEKLKSKLKEKYGDVAPELLSLPGEDILAGVIAPTEGKQLALAEAHKKETWNHIG